MDVQALFDTIMKLYTNSKDNLNNNSSAVKCSLNENSITKIYIILWDKLEGDEFQIS